MADSIGTEQVNWISWTKRRAQPMLPLLMEFNKWPDFVDIPLALEVEKMH